MLTSDTEDTLTRLTGMVVGGTKAAARLQTQQQTTSLSASGTERQASGQAALKMDARTSMHSPQETAQASKEKAICSSSGCRGSITTRFVQLSGSCGMAVAAYAKARVTATMVRCSATLLCW
eukprot:6180563-Pleurochrysis_carterae.AAC.1